MYYTAVLTYLPSGTPEPNRVHQVQPGETLDRIAAKYFEDSTKWRSIAAANGVRMVECRCAIDTTWAPRRVEVLVATRVDLAILGQIEVRAVGAAEFSPTAVVSSAVGERTETPAKESSRAGLVERFVEVAALR